MAKQRTVNASSVGSTPTPPARKTYMRNYQRAWIAERRNSWIKENGPCRGCGSDENPEVDHINPQTKEIPIRSVWSRRKEIRDKELAKCQVLCKPCHNAKTILQFTRPISHGKRNSYQKYGCRCTGCKDAYSIWRKARYLRTKT